MIINSVTVIYFSPTSSTKKIVFSVVNGFGVEKINEINLTEKQERTENDINISTDILVIGIPVYAGMIPKGICNSIKKIHGNKTPTIIITVYGNISKGIASEEIQVVLEKNNFFVLGKGYFIGEHSFSTKSISLAKNRPNDKDLQIASELGINIKRILSDTIDIEGLRINQNIIIKWTATFVFLLNKWIYQRSGHILIELPNIDPYKCNKCGLCYNNCPVQAINENTLEINAKKCISCFSCVRICPREARRIVYKNKNLFKIVFLIKNKYKEPVIKLGSCI